MTGNRSIVYAALAASLLSPNLAHAYMGAQFAKDAKVNLFDAEAAALKSVDGKVKSEELAPMNGGKSLRYIFEIQAGSETHEVVVDANTGAVLENKPKRGT